MLIPERRDMQIHLNADALLDYHPHSREACHLLNTVSVLFPEGERFFMDSVRQHRNGITDPELQRAMTAFIGQEAMHGREHQALTDMMTAAGLPADKQDAAVGKLLKWGLDTLPKPWPLAITVALEHFTAMLADLVMKYPDFNEGVEPSFKAIWTWHALEETEHKAVAYDVWVMTQGASPRSYLIRVSAQLLATGLLFPIWFANTAQNMRADKQYRGGIGSLLRSADFLFGRVGLLRRGLGMYLDYFRPGFHPWDHGSQEDFPALLQKVMTDLEPYMAGHKKPAGANRRKLTQASIPPPAESAAAAGAVGQPA